MNGEVTSKVLGVRIKQTLAGKIFIKSHQPRKLITEIIMKLKKKKKRGHFTLVLVQHKVRKAKAAPVFFLTTNN